MVEEYILLLHKVQLHVWVLDNGHLQVVHEIPSKQLFETIWVVYSGEVGGEVGTTHIFLYNCLLIISCTT